jgi:hypothetical protein
LQLKGIPTGMLAGTLTGVFHMSGDLTGDVTLTLTIAGSLMAGPGGTVVRVPNTTTVSGTAVQGDGTFAVMVTI